MSRLLDSSAFIHHMRHGVKSNVTARMLAALPGSICLCSVVLAELLYGAVCSGPAHEARHRGMIAGLRAQFAPLPFDDAAGEEYARVRAHLTAAGQSFGPNDLMIAAIALAHGLTVVTHNTAEFGRVPGLSTEDWQ